MKKNLFRRQHVLLLPGIVLFLATIIAVEAFLPLSSLHQSFDLVIIPRPSRLFVASNSNVTGEDSSIFQGKLGEEVATTIRIIKEENDNDGKQQQEYWISKQFENNKEEAVDIAANATKEVQKNQTIATAVDNTIITDLNNASSTIETTAMMGSNDSNFTEMSHSANNNSIVVNSTLSDETEAIINEDQKKENNVTTSSSLSNETEERVENSENIVDNKKENDSISTEGKVPPPPVYNGIGGKGGFSYDVNKLKKNLVQQAVADCKEQLWDLLEGPFTATSSSRITHTNNKDNDDEETVSVMLQRQRQEQQAAIEEKFAALCQANPVYTTTDSYLLEGQWTFVFRSKKPARVLMDPDRFVSEYESKIPGDIVGETRSGSRKFVLESLEADQDPFVVDKKRYYFGILEREHVFDVTSLTRTSLELDLFQRTWKLFGRFPLWRSQYNNNNKIPPTEEKMNLKILYVDSDLCISTTNGNMDSPFTIYTRSDAWTARTQRLKRKWRSLQSRVITRLQPRLRRWNNKVRRSQDNDNSVNTRTPLNSKISTMIGMGNLDDGMNNNDAAWEGDMDPFVNLPAGRRQDMLKKLRVGEIKAMGDKQQELTEKMHQEKQFNLIREKTFTTKKQRTKKRWFMNKSKNIGAQIKTIPKFLRTRDSPIIDPSSDYSIKLPREKPFNQAE